MAGRRRRASRQAGGREVARIDGVTRLTPARRNIELKARCLDLNAAARAVAAAGAVDKGVLVQTDTYFNCATGRLKLRRIEGDGAQVIWYSRPDHTASRASDYRVDPVADPLEMLSALTQFFGRRGEVHKRRQLFLWENVRIHLDNVRGLGTFVEFEAVIEHPEQEAVAARQLAHLARVIGIQEADRVAVSYSDLLGLA